MSRIAVKRQKTGVQGLYTEKQVQVDLIARIKAGESLRTIAHDLGEDILTHADIQRGLQGKFSKNPAKRAAFHLRALALAPACPYCNHVPVKAHCDCRSKSKRPAPRRIAISVENMKSAAGTILRNLDPDKTQELIRRLSEDEGNPTARAF